MHGPGALSLVNDLKMYDYRGAGIIGPSHSASGSGSNAVSNGDSAVSDSLTLLAMMLLLLRLIWQGPRQALWLPCWISRWMNSSYRTWKASAISTEIRAA